MLDIPEEVDVTDVLDCLTLGQDAGHCDWDDGSISEPHGEQLRAVMLADDPPDWVPRGPA